MTEEELAEIRKRARKAHPWDMVYHVHLYWRMRVDIDDLIAEVERLQEETGRWETFERRKPGEAQRALAFVQNFAL